MATSVETRWWIVSTWKECKNTAETAKKCLVTKKVAARWIRRYKTTKGVADKAKTGRPRVMSAEAKRRAYHILLGGTHPGADGVARQLFREGLTPKIVSNSTLIRGAKWHGREIRKPIKCLRGKPAKRLTQATKDKRLSFALANQNTNWSGVMFTDRKKFNFSYPGAKVKPTEWVLEGTQRQATAVNHPLSFNLYAGLTKYGMTVHHQVAGTSKAKTMYKNKKGEVAKNITSQEYTDVLGETLFPEGQKLFSTQGKPTWVFMQDNDPTHRVAIKAIKEWNDSISPRRLRNASSISLLPNWPPNSPDLNPIENLWGLVQAKVNAKGCKTFEEFKAEVIKQLKKVPKEYLVNMIDSISKRIQKVIELEGDKLSC